MLNSKNVLPHFILLIAFVARVAGLANLPPGWRDDEVIEATVHARRVLSGDLPFYFVEAEGHEPLYHYTAAAWIALTGNSLFGVRVLSAFFGLAAVAGAYRVSCQLFGRRTAAVTALLLAVSFWALMYSRVKLRHIAELPFALLALSSLIAAIKTNSRRAALAGGVLSALGLYTYPAALALPIIFIALMLYFGVLKQWRRASIVGIALGVAVALYAPLTIQISLNAQRLAVVGGPLAALRQGDWWPVFENFVATLAMFGNQGDPEALYNIPGRPVFGAVAFYIFLAGVVIAITRWRDWRYALMIIWLVGGLAPTIASTPPASLGHSITALPATFLLTVLPVTTAWRSHSTWRRVLAVVLIAGVAFRDLTDYFRHWAALPEVRFLYKADLHSFASSVRHLQPQTYVLDGTLSIWDRRAFALEGVHSASPARFVNAEWATVFTPAPALSNFEPATWQRQFSPVNSLPTPVAFENGLTFVGWSQQGSEIIGYWHVEFTYAIEEPVVGASVASPPFPAFVFAHLVAPNGELAGGSDRFDVDAFALQPGDRFAQRHVFNVPPGAYALIVGLYNQTTGVRYLTLDGNDSVRVGEVIIP